MPYTQKVQNFFARRVILTSSKYKICDFCFNFIENNPGDFCWGGRKWCRRSLSRVSRSDLRRYSGKVVRRSFVLLGALQSPFAADGASVLIPTPNNSCDKGWVRVVGFVHIRVHVIEFECAYDLCMLSWQVHIVTAGLSTRLQLVKCISACWSLSAGSWEWPFAQVQVT